MFIRTLTRYQFFITQRFQVSCIHTYIFIIPRLLTSNSRYLDSFISFLPKPPFQVCDLQSYSYFLTKYFLTATVFIGFGPSQLGIHLLVETSWKDNVFFSTRSLCWNSWGQTFLLKACFVLFWYSCPWHKVVMRSSLIKLRAYWRDIDFHGKHNLHVVY
jgi:hypothetical protein